MNEMRERAGSLTLPPLRLPPISRTSTTAWRDGAAPDENVSFMQTRSFDSALLPRHAPRTLCRGRRDPLRRYSLDSDVLDEPLATSPRTALRHVMGVLSELGSKDGRDFEHDKAFKHAVSEFSVKDAGLFTPSQALSSVNSKTATLPITPNVVYRSLTGSESGKHSKRPTPPVKPTMACRSLTQEEAPWDTTKHRMVGCAGGQSYRQRIYNR